MGSSAKGTGYKTSKFTVNLRTLSEHHVLMRRAFLSVLALVTAGLASAQGSVAGQYQLRVPVDAARVAHLAGRRTANGSLTLHVTNRFTLEVADTVRHGRYRVDDDHLTLYMDDGSMAGGLLRGETISLEGLTFEHGSPATVASRRFPTDASSGRLDRAVRRTPVELPAATVPIDEPPVVRTILVAPPVAVFTPDPVTPTIAPAERVVPARRLLRMEDCSGCWTVRAKGVEQKDQRMELKADGTFRFGMKGATSEGTWTVEGSDVVLTYTKVDGEPLEEGASGKKRISFADDSSAFQIDTYRYERATDK